MGEGRPLEVRHPTIVVVGAVAVALGAALWGLGSASWRGDEVFSLELARLPTSELLSLLGEREANGVLHTLLLHLWVQVEDGAWWVRSASVLAVVATVPLVAALARRCSTPTGGAIAAVLFAVHAYAVQYAQEARTYGLLVLLTAASALLLLRALERPGTGRMVAWGLVASLLGWAHLFGFFVLAAQLLALALRRRPPPDRRTWVAAAVVVAAHVPIAVLLLAQRGNDQIDWIGSIGLRTVGFTLAEVSGSFGLWLVAAMGLACAPALLDLWRGRRELDEQRWAILLLTTTVVVPFVVAGIVTLFEPFWAPRYFVEVVPAVVALAGAGLVRLPRRWGLALLAVVLVLQLAGLHRWLTEPDRHDHAAAAALLAQPTPDGVQAGDGIVVTPFWDAGALGLHLDDEGVPDELVLLDPGPPWIGVDPTSDRTRLGAEDLADPALERVWVVRYADEEELAGESEDDLAEQADLLAAAGFEPVDERAVPGLLVLRYER